jgi:hypothetical protein
MKRLLVAAVVVASLGHGAPARGQALYGSVVGVVSDSSGAALPGVSLTVTHSGTGLEQQLASDGAGRYAFRNLPPGPYSLTARHAGFREHKTSGLPVTAGNPVRLDVRLAVGGVEERVEVTGETTPLQTEKADLHTEVSGKDVVSLPLNPYRNYQRLFDLVPGATPTQYQNEEIDTPGRSLRTWVNGTQPHSNTTRIDGAVSVNIWLPHHVGYVQPAETIETVNVSTSNFDADQGLAAGAAITVVTKSGTNELHGSAFYFRNQDELNANTFFNDAFSLPKAPLSRTTFGGTLGGPIRRDRLFFFASWERYLGRNGRQESWGVPSLKMRAGDFSEVAAAYPGFRLYNPYTGGAGGTGRQPFPGFIIPADLISPVAQQVLSYYPAPNTVEDLNSNRLPDDYVVEREATTDRDNFDVKLTWQRTPTHVIWARAGLLDAEVVDNFILGWENGSLGDTRVWVGAVGHTWTLSPSVVIDGTFGLNRLDQQVTGPDYGTDYGSEVLGIPGTNGSDVRESGMPDFNSVYRLGTWSYFPLFRHDRSYTLSSALTWSAGRHQVRAGFDVVRHELNQYQAEIGGGGVRGGFTFTGLETSAPGYVPLGWNGFAAFLLGLAGSTGKEKQAEEMTGREWQLAFFASDRWQVGGKLTLDLGLRCEVYPLMKRADRGIERLDLDTFEMLIGGKGSTPEDVGIEARTVYLAPRVGAVYRLTDTTAVRAAYGQTINPLPWSRPLRGTFPLDVYFTRTAEQYAWTTTLEQGIPPVPVPDISTGRVPVPPNTFIRTPNPTDVDRATIQQANVAVEQRLPGHLSLEVAYVHTRTDGGYASRNLNYSEPGAGQAGRKLYAMAGTADIGDWAARTRTRYHGLQVALNRPFRNGLMLKGAYTLSRAQNETDEDGWIALAWAHPAVLERNFALATYDRTHVFQLGFAWEVPLGRGSRSVLGRIVQDWQLSGVVSAFSGAPFSIVAANPQLNCPGCGAVVIDVAGDPRPTGAAGSSTEPWYDKTLFSLPTGTSLAGFGNSARNQFRSPGVWNVDLSVVRAFRVGRVRPEIRVEALNVLNHTTWGVPVTTFTSPTFLTFTPSQANSGPFSAQGTRGTNTPGPRVVQLGLRLEF